jgi:fengycin family lipopeptide synthetase D
VELEEIEKQLLAHHGIKKAVIISKKYKSDSIDLCAYYVTEQGAISTSAGSGQTMEEPPLSVSELRSFLHAKLPDYMVPSYFLQLEEMPLTKHGKVDLGKLPEIGPGNMKLETEYAPPVSEMEKAIAAIWQDILQLDKVGIDDNFFDLGGNSLDIIKVNSRLKSVSEKNLSVVLMFKYPTIRSLGMYFSRAGEEHVSVKIDRSGALERGERGRNVRRQMRKKTRK